MRQLIILTSMFCLFCIISATLLASPPPPTNYRISSPTPQLQNEEQVWVCPTDSNIVIAVWRDFRLGYRQIGIGRSIDGGDTWTDSLIRMFTYPRQSDPCLDVDADGNFYVNFMDYGSGPFKFTTLKSVDKGVSWSETGIFPATTEYVEDKQFITIDRTNSSYRGNLYLGWTRFIYDDVNNMIMFARLQKDSLFFDTPILIDTVPNWIDCGIEWGQAGFFAQPLVGPDGTVYMFWNGNHVDMGTCEFTVGISMVKSYDGGETFTPIERIQNVYVSRPSIDGGITAYANPTGTIDIFGGENDGNIYIAYCDTDTAAADYNYWDTNIKFTHSTDDGVTWSEPYYINDDSTGSEAVWDQFHPWLYCNQDGILVCIFYDQRLDTLNHYSFDLFAAYSFDAGHTFTTNQRITEVSTNPDYIKSSDLDDPKAGKIAEYIGVTAFKDHINATWTDGRNSNQEVWGANWLLPLMPPRLFSPIKGEQFDTIPYLDWAISWKTDDDSYRVEVATDSLFSDIESIDIVDTAGIIPSGLKIERGMYDWRAKVFKQSTSDSSDYSKTGRFEILTPDVCGDADHNEIVNILDITFLISYLYKGGAAPESMWAADPDGNCAVNILDITYLISYLYKGGPAPICDCF